MPLVDTEQLRTNCDNLMVSMANDANAGIVRPSVTARLMRNVTVESTFVQYDRQFRFVGDEALERGGREEGPFDAPLSQLRFVLPVGYQLRP
jgi:hypothetical protein